MKNKKFAFPLGLVLVVFNDLLFLIACIGKYYPFVPWEVIAVCFILPLTYLGTSAILILNAKKLDTLSGRLFALYSILLIDVIIFVMRA